MKHSATIIMVLAVCAIAAFAVQAQGTKLVVVSSEVILRELPEAQQASKELDFQIRAWQDTLEKMSADFQKGYEEYQKKRDIYSQAAREAEERRLTEMQQRIREYNSQKFDSRQGEAVVLRERKLAPIREKILKMIEVVAKEDKVSVVLDKANEATILYVDAKLDLTYKVLDRLKRGN